VNGLPAVLAIDGGNSKTDLALVAEDGALLATVRGPGMRSPEDLGSWLEALGALIARAQLEAGREGQVAARHITACVANADLPEEEERLAAALRGGRKRVADALLAHPLVGQYELAGRLADRLIAENASYLAWA